MTKSYTLISFLFFVPLMIWGQVNSNQKAFTFQKLNSNKLRSFKQGTYLGFVIKDTCHTNNCEEKFNRVQGKLISASDSGIVIDVTYQETKTYYHDSIVETKLYADFVPIENKKFRILISNDKIKYIEYQPKSSVLTGIIGSTALLTATIIAPITSIKYSTGTFNSTKYFSIVVPSLITSTISFATYFALEKESTNLL